MKFSRPAVPSPAGLRTVFRKQNKFKRHAYLWAVLLSLPVITWTWLLHFDIFFWRVIYGGLLVGLVIAGIGLLNPNIPLRWIERFIILVNFAFLLSKYIYLLYNPSSHELGNWSGEIQAVFWSSAIGFILVYIFFERRIALWICIGQIVLFLLVTLPLFSGFSDEILREFFRLETRLIAVAFITLILAKAKDDLIETQNRALHVETLAYLDPLTGVPNRRALSQMIEKRMTEPSIQLGLVVADLDFFKLINDTYGHDTGDAILRETVALFKGCLRERDLIGRWGGEEFVILLQDGNTAAHIQTIERLRRNIESQVFVNGLRVTCSFGGSDYQRGDTFERLFFRADQALYAAKSKGRNRIEWL
ncbi:MAG: GGDEF domain-containing protein [Chloroflexota bacterium]|nr:GGDEF domain-containing protein [Chloroflexota bacterium]MBI5704347.1 GGDEF domain-containing protein [Chloroflexota bacterium]